MSTQSGASISADRWTFSQAEAAQFIEMNPLRLKAIIPENCMMNLVGSHTVAVSLKTGCAFPLVLKNSVS